MVAAGIAIPSPTRPYWGVVGELHRIDVLHLHAERRRMGNTAALLPAQPNTTWDWIERMRFIDTTGQKPEEKR